MLSRIANNLFWMGRYIERVEHISRFTKVNYFAGLDAPSSISREFILNSLLKMNGISNENNQFISDEQALMKIGFDKSNPNSIINCVTAARENARSARDIISTELWESINRFYHFTLQYNAEAFSKTSLFDFSQKLHEQISIIKGRIDSTLLHNETWTVICLGLFSERCAQIVRIIDTKLQDLKFLKKEVNSLSIEAHQIEIMLRSLESFDVSRKFYRKSPTLKNSLEFLVLNQKFPRSVASCVRKLKNHIENLHGSVVFSPNSAGFLIGRLSARLNYLLIDDFIEKPEQLVRDLQNELYTINTKLLSEYFSY